MSLFPSLDNLEDEEPKIEGGLNITFSTVEYTYQSFLNKLLDGSMSDLLIQQNICNHYDKYCNYDNFQNPEIAPVMRRIWTNERFLINFKSLLNSKKMKAPISLYNRFICKIAYDYYADKIAPQKLENDKICDLLFDIVTLLNENKIIPLTAYMYRVHALFLVMLANSSYDYFACVNRVNYFIMESLNELDTLQIIDIYSKVFNDGNFSTIFNATMSDTTDMTKLTPAECAGYLKITKAIFVILNSIPSVEISKVIRGYKNYIAVHKVTARVQIEKFIEEYPRAKVVFDSLWID